MADRSSEVVSVPSAPHDMAEAIAADPAALEAWMHLDPELQARYVTWIEDTNFVEERGSRLAQLVVELIDGTAAEEAPPEDLL